MKLVVLRLMINMKNKEIIFFYHGMGTFAKLIWAGKSIRCYTFAMLFHRIILFLVVNILFIYAKTFEIIISAKTLNLEAKNTRVILLLVLVIFSNTFMFYGIIKNLKLYFKTPKNHYFETK